MKLKLDDSGQAVLREGLPVYVQEDGQETPFDAAEAMAKIAALNAEAKKRREQAQTLAKQLEPFQGIEDPAGFLDRAQKALALAQGLEADQLVEAQQVEALRQELESAWKARLEESRQGFAAEMTHKNEQLAGFEKRIGELLDAGGELGLVARDPAGEVMPSEARPGKPASPEEAIELFLTRLYPGGQAILKAGAGGSGGSGNQAPPTGRDMSQLPAQERLKAAHRVG